MIIAIDFDGTIVEHEFPRIGKAVPFALDFMRAFQDMGAKLLLWTMRSGEHLTAAIEFCRENGIEFYGINSNPQQSSWTSSPKAYAHLYIDDAAFGCPLLRTHPPSVHRPMVDWMTVGPAVLQALRAHSPEPIVE
jgi:hypothetical protein